MFIILLIIRFWTLIYPSITEKPTNYVKKLIYQLYNILGAIKAGYPLFFTEETSVLLRYLNPSRPDSRQREKINLNFYVHTSLWCLKRFYKGLKPWRPDIIFFNTTFEAGKFNKQSYITMTIFNSSY